MSGAGVGGYAGSSADVNLGAQAEKARLEVGVIEECAIEYKMDGANRMAKAKCYHCGSRCELHQERNVSGEWSPPFEPKLTLFGWTFANNHWFCGRFCAMRVEQQIRAGHKVVPVEKIADASYQARRLYAESAAGPKPTKR